MKKLKLVCLLISLIVGVTMVNAQETDANVAITLERTACFGTCPIYTLTIYEDGTVVYNGERFVDVTGEQTAQIPPETVDLMVEALHEAGYFDWDEEYTSMTVTDLPYVITSVTRDGETHRINRYGGDDSAPLALPFLENWIDLMANSAMWTGAEMYLNHSHNGALPVATLERTACYGMCPVYTVAAYADGNVVFTGIANVDELGVHIFQVEPASIDSIGVRAASLGYFNWADSYQQMVMTDQPTVTTTIQWEDDYKRIVRYDGDPNAPVGLVWVEDIIDMLVTDLVG